MGVSPTTRGCNNIHILVKKIILGVTASGE